MKTTMNFHVDGCMGMQQCQETVIKVPKDFPIIVCLCGSTKFKKEFTEANFRETMVGKIVLSVGWFSHADGHVYFPTDDEKIALDELHKRKVYLSDEVFVINVGGYIGSSIRSEIDYAKQLGRPIRYLEHIKDED